MAVSIHRGDVMAATGLASRHRVPRASINARNHAKHEHDRYIMGPEVAELEARLAARTGARHCVAVASGAGALVIALTALGIKAGDDVITTPFSSTAAIDAVVLVGATPVFADVEAATGNLDARLLAERITARTRAIIPVSLYGQPADMDAINAIAAPYGIAVIEDAAQSFGATYRGRPSGNLATIGCTSFFSSQPPGCHGDGGALFTSDDDLARAMRAILVHGQSHRHPHARPGVGGRMGALQCAVVLARLARLDWEIAQRQRAAADYDALLRHQIAVLAVRPDRSSAYARYAVLVDERDRVCRALAAAGIPIAVHYPVPIHRQGAYAHLAAGAAYPAADALARRVLSLPMGPFLDRDGARRVVRALLAACRPTGALPEPAAEHGTCANNAIAATAAADAVGATATAATTAPAATTATAS